MKIGMLQHSRRSLLKKGSLGVVGAIGAERATALLAHAEAPARADAVNPVVGVWDVTVNLKMPLGVSLPGIPTTINGRMLLNEDNTWVGDSDIDLLPPLGGPPVLGSWIQQADGSYALTGKRPALAGTLGKIAGTIVLNITLTVAGDTITGVSTLTVPLISLPVQYAFTGTRLVVPKTHP